MGRGPALAAAAVVVIAAIVAALWFAPDLARDDEAPIEASSVSPAAASAAEVKLSRLESRGEEADLSAIELTSLIRYRPEVWALGAVIEPTVHIEGDTIAITGAVAVDEIPSQPELDALRFLLPDTAELRFSGRVRATEGTGTLLEIGAIEVAGMPIPRQYHALILERIRGQPGPGMSPGALVLPFPAAVSSARIEDGELILTP